MRNAEYFYETVRRYRRGLSEINERFDKQVAEKEGYRGSPRYVSDMEKIEKARAAEIATLRADCAESFDTCIKSMELHTKERPMIPPTAEQIALLQALQMREHLTRDDLEHAATSMKGCAVGLGFSMSLPKNMSFTDSTPLAACPTNLCRTKFKPLPGAPGRF